MEHRSYNTMAMGRSMDLLTKDESGNCWKRRTRTEQALIIVCSILSISVIALIIAVVLLSNEQTDPGHTTSEVPGTRTTPATPTDEECVTDVCQHAAKQLKASIDDSINPCDDFYSYVCSGWKREHPIPESMHSMSTFSILSDNIIKDLKTVLPNITFEEGDVRTKTKIFYSSCINNETRESKGSEVLNNILQKLGGWPLLGNPLETGYAWLDALAKSIIEFGKSPIISVGVGADAKNTKRNIIQLDQTSLGIGRNVLTKKNESDDRMQEILNAYKIFIKKSAQILYSRKDESELDRDIEDMIQFEMLLAKYTRPAEQQRDPNSVYKKMTILELQSLLEVDITGLLNRVFKNISEINNSTEVIVREFDYLYQTSKLLSSKTIETKTIANYIGWRVVQTYGSATTQKFRDAVLEFNKIVSGVKEAEPLDETCIKLTNSYFEFALGSVFINNGFEVETKTEIENMITKLKTAFGELLKTNTWMNEESRKGAEYKLSQMIPMVAYPPWINDTKELNDYYEKLGDIKEDTFFENVISLVQFGVQMELNKINKPHNRGEEWGSGPAVVNAFYDPSSNIIIFPAGILTYPFYQVGLPPALNFAGIGSVIGHEITHGFDDEGSQYDAEGNLKNWWPPEVKSRFRNESKCFVEQYGSYKDPMTGMMLNGNITLGENIADNGGVREAFKAYKLQVAETGRNIRLPGLNLTSDQLFFVSFSYIWCSNERKEYIENNIQYNPHSLPPFRVLGSCSNFEEFSKTFNCPENSTMNPEHKCLLW